MSTEVFEGDVIADTGLTTIVPHGPHGVVVVFVVVKRVLVRCLKRGGDVPTAKNGQTADFYDRMGMECISIGDDSSKHYAMTLDKVIELKDYYNIKVL